MYRTLFLTFLRIGAFTIGGGYAMLPLIEREVVGRGWISRKDFFDVFTVSQSMPGIFAVNIAIFLGYRLKKIKGSLVCLLGTILPSFVIILAIALFFTQIKDNPWVERAFKGLRPAVVALIAVPCISAARTASLTWKTVWIAVAAALLIWLADVSPIYVIIASALAGLAYFAAKRE
jgi:chromate transporter